MAERPIFIPYGDGNRLVREVLIDFAWNPGFAPVQKKKNIAALHASAAAKGFPSLLEVSTKSEEALGVRLSAFNLKVLLNDGRSIPLESAYQGSKVFERAGPFIDLYNLPPREAKRDERLQSSGYLKGFRFEGVDWGLEPKTAFYDWLYIFALKEHADYLKKLFAYDGFTDIEFNPEKSLNCQARSCAILVSLLKKGLFPKVAYDKELFISVLRPDSFAQPHSQDLRQGSLL